MPEFPTFPESSSLDAGVTYPGFSDAIARARNVLADTTVDAATAARVFEPMASASQRTPFTDRLDSLSMTGEKSMNVEVVQYRPTHPEPIAHQELAAQPAVTEPEFDEDAEFAALMEHLALRDLARERLRARLLAMHASAKQRTTYELVFIMLAAAVTILVTAPPLVDVLLALHGTRP